MHPAIKIILKIIWTVLLLYWLISSFKVKQQVQSEPLFKRFLFYWLPLLIGIILLGPGEWYGHSLLREQFVPHSNLVGIIGDGLCMAGVFLACWSRYLLGKNWSVSVQLKQEHELIEKGPYAYVRHPIYTGLLLLYSGNALIVGDWRGILAVLIVFVSFWRKFRLEEEWLGRHFGDLYDAYKRRTKALLPWIL
jgi:protein-S-isoprenylcysteine O-methyltransferase Ste14